MTAWLLPREHGAYAQLGFPLLSGAVLGSPGAASWLFIAAAVLLFLAGEPLAVLVGARGRRRRDELGVAARIWLAVLAGAGTACGFAALYLAPPAARWLGLAPVVLSAGLVAFVLSKKVKSVPGEVMAAAALSSLHLPVAAAGDVAGVAVWGPAVMWFVIAVVATLAVHAIKSRVTGATPWVIPAAAWSPRLALLGALAATVLAPDARAVALAACLPLAGVIVVNRLSPSPRRLKQVGWTVVAANALALTVLAAGL